MNCVYAKHTDSHGGKTNRFSAFSPVKYFRHQLVCLCCFFICIAALNNAFADSLCPNQIRGVNLAGAEFGGDHLPGVAGRDYKFPSMLQLNYYSNAGFNATRLPLSWERLQPKLFGDLDKTYTELLLAYMDQAQRAGQRVVVDVHNYDRYRNQIVGSPEVPPEAFRDLWKRLALLLRQQPALYAYGLMNEPHNIPPGLWHSTAQFGVDGIREVDSEHFIYVAGNDWSGAASWPKSNPQPFVNDPGNKIVYEAHVYFDDDFSGRYQKQIGNIDLGDRVHARLQPFISWLTTFHQKGVIGEWGIPTKDLELKGAVDSFISTTNAACLDWFIWSGGQWSPAYNLSLEPVNGEDKSMLSYLKKLIQ
jgi:endoglucanase